MAAITLSPSQERGFQAFKEFYLDPTQFVMKLRGYSGSGKSTLVSALLAHLDEFDDLILMVDEDYKPREVVLTATTNQAAEAFFIQAGGNIPVSTIHSKIGVRPQKNYETGKTELIRRGGAEDLYYCLLLIDESSFIDQELLTWIFKTTHNCKIVFIGDPCQFTPISSTYMPAFALKGADVELTDLMRQNPGPLAVLCNEFRDAVFHNKWPKIVPDDNEIFLLPHDKFEGALLKAFNDEPTFGNTKVLAYTNERVIQINNFLSREILGNLHPQPGQRMMVNKAVSRGKSMLTTGQEVFIESLEEEEMFQIEGWRVFLRGSPAPWFLPRRHSDYKARYKLANTGGDHKTMRQMDETCVDLRPSFACTVNKSQGSTFDTVFIDLNDVCKRIHQPNQLARALYVGLSRARRRVVLTGDV